MQRRLWFYNTNQKSQGMPLKCFGFLVLASFRQRMSKLVIYEVGWPLFSVEFCISLAYFPCDYLYQGIECILSVFSQTQISQRWFKSTSPTIIMHCFILIHVSSLSRFYSTKKHLLYLYMSQMNNLPWIIYKVNWGSSFMYHLREIISLIFLFCFLFSFLFFNSEVIYTSESWASLPVGAWSSKIHVSVPWMNKQNINVL